MKKDNLAGRAQQLSGEITRLKRNVHDIEELNREIAGLRQEFADVFASKGRESRAIREKLSQLMLDGIKLSIDSTILGSDHPKYMI